MEMPLLLRSTEVDPLSSGWNISKKILVLDKWEASLLDNVKCPTDIFTAMKKMEQSEFLVVTNGSVGEIDLSFGWKISTSNGEIIAEHAGPAFGQASSFRAKGYGVLSALSFFRRAM
eukprot:9312284-Ditylum_brightwellii.AAC.1